jgi:HAE1 family hydrophobic/amphiphilic exporter-1
LPAKCALASRSIGIDEVATAVQKANVNLPTGTLYGANQAFTVQATGQLNDAAAYRPVIVASREGFPVRLGDLGRVIDSVENDKIAAWYNHARAITLAIQRQPGTNTVEVVDAVKEQINRLRAEIPASIRLDLLYDRSVSIRESVADIKAMRPDYIVPAHCTGFEAIVLFSREMPDQFTMNTAGTQYTFTA